MKTEDSSVFINDKLKEINKYGCCPRFYQNMSVDMKYPDKYWAGGFLYNPVNKSIFLHKRDGNTKFNPNKWAFFGGLNEAEDKKPIDCFSRELKEEIGLEITSDRIIKLCDYMNVEFNTYRIVFYVESNVSENELILGEGAGFGWVSLDRIQEYDITDKTYDDLKLFLEKHRKGS